MNLEENVPEPVNIELHGVPGQLSTWSTPVMNLQHHRINLSLNEILALPTLRLSEGREFAGDLGGYALKYEYEVEDGKIQYWYAEMEHVGKTHRALLIVTPSYIGAWSVDEDNKVVKR